MQTVLTLNKYYIALCIFNQYVMNNIANNIANLFLQYCFVQLLLLFWTIATNYRVIIRLLEVIILFKRLFWVIP